jgi:hypothetical protein
MQNNPGLLKRLKEGTVRKNVVLKIPGSNQVAKFHAKSEGFTDDLIAVSAVAFHGLLDCLVPFYFEGTQPRFEDHERCIQCPGYGLVVFHADDPDAPPDSISIENKLELEIDGVAPEFVRIAFAYNPKRPMCLVMDRITSLLDLEAGTHKTQLVFDQITVMIRKMAMLRLYATDLKAENVGCTNDGEAKLLDFAQLIQVGTLVSPGGESQHVALGEDVTTLFRLLRLSSEAMQSLPIMMELKKIAIRTQSGRKPCMFANLPLGWLNEANLILMADVMRVTYTPPEIYPSGDIARICIGEIE